MIDRARLPAGWRGTLFGAPPTLASRLREEGPRGPTEKAVLRRGDGLEYECVRIPMGRGRETICVSSQVGCAMACRFCETGRMGRLADLSGAEIAGQVEFARTALGWAPTHVVFMGMGEPLDNVASVCDALRILTDSKGFGMAHDRLTVCTVGRIDGLARLRALGLRRLNLAVSLNAADDALRSRLMPVNKQIPLAELQAALVAWRPRRNACLGIHWCLMPGINDAPADAAAVAAFCAPLGRCMVHVIPYNPGSRPLTRAPSDEEVAAFVGWLRDAGLSVRRRVTKGRAVMAACGQLGNVAPRRRGAGAGTTVAEA